MAGSCDHPATYNTQGRLALIRLSRELAGPAFFKQGLADLNYTEGRNVLIEYKWARSHPELLPSFAADLVRDNVSVIAAVSGEPAARAAMAVTTAIPIVFITPGDPVQQGLVASLNQTGGKSHRINDDEYVTDSQADRVHQ